MNGQLDKAFVSFRVGVPLWLRSERFDELLDLFAAHGGVTDEITLFTSETHPPLPLDVIRSRCEILPGRMATARERGYRTGINILATIGHHDENLPRSLQADYARMTDLHGGLCQGSFCPNDERFRVEYVRPVYQALVGTDPDYVWIDDDVRLRGHMPISDTCFCDHCLELFAAESGFHHTRESFQQALAAGERGEQLALRRAWLAHNRKTVGRLLALIETTVHAVRPGLPLGFMDGSRFYEGFDLDTWAEILSGPAGAEVLWRPGGGNYTEESLDGVAGKAHELGREAAVLPDSVVCIQSELESFPYQRLRKSIQYTALEAATYIAAGCTGTAFNVLSMYDEPLDEYEPLVGGLRHTRPFLDLLASTFGRLHPEGVHTGWNKESACADATAKRLAANIWRVSSRSHFSELRSRLSRATSVSVAKPCTCARAVVCCRDRPVATCISRTCRKTSGLVISPRARRIAPVSLAKSRQPSGSRPDSKAHSSSISVESMPPYIERLMLSSLG